MILITGATGNVGRPLVGLFVETGVPFKVFVRDPGRARGALGRGVQLVEGDFAAPASIEGALGGVDRLFLLSGNPEHEGNVIDAAARSGVGLVVKQSALAAGLEPPPFHRGIEEKLKRSGLGFTHLRPTAFMQTLAGYLPRLIDAEGVFRLPAGSGRVAWVDTRDIAAVAFRALTEEGHEIMVERGMPPSMADFLITFYGSVRWGQTDFVTNTVPEVTGDPGRTFDAFAREQASAFVVAGSRKAIGGSSDSG
jgi:(4-alkanoyl-5-oxo-2,5-dihydrofuran-3-yl)methyl phosphate reductase